MFRKLLLPIILLVIVALTVWYFMPNSTKKSQNADILVKVEIKDIPITVHATGELKAKFSEKIRGPQGMRTNKIYETSLTDIVPEGTLVKAGQYVASLDKTEVDTRMKDIQTEVEKTETQLEQTKIDTAIEMRSLRDQLVNLHFSLEEKKLQLELNKYEPQATIRQVELDVEKIKRDAIQLDAKIRLTKEKSIARIKEIQASLRQDENKVDRLAALAKEFTVMAPKDGMIIYYKSWNGKIGPGSRVSSWDPVIAELPDLSTFLSKTYVNEVDISKIALGQECIVRVDAFPDKSFKGIVKQVANIGEQLKNYDAKVFEVMVELMESDSILRPAMTTENEIEIASYESALSVPIEAIQIDSLTFVYKKVGGRTVKQEIITSAANDNQMIVAHGLSAGDQVYINVPEGSKDAEFNYVDISTKETVIQQLAADKQKREKDKAALAKQVKKEDLQSDEGSSEGSFIVF